MSNPALAAVVIEEILAWGARHFVVCAGARNAPLVLALLAAPPPIRVWRHFDERSAAFFALGLAKRTREPVAIVTTSGTAAAELLPAAVEAHYSGVPLVLITADRPKRFRATGAPQAIEQAGMFGPYCEGCLDVEAAEDFPRDFPWRRRRPIQVNPCFEEPGRELVAAVNWENGLARGARFPMKQGMIGDHTLLDRFLENFADGGLVLLGDIDAPDRPGVASFLEELGAPVWAEATSGLRESPALKLVAHPAPPRKVLRIGGVPSLRLWRDLEELPRIPVLSVTRTGFPGLARPCETMDWLDFSRVLAPKCEVAIETGDDTRLARFPGAEPSLIRSLSEAIPSDARVFLGNSLPIREWNLAATRAAPHAEVFASRGANGIDGELSTFLGLSEGAEESWGVFGDLTTLYDLNAPWVLDQLSPGRRRIVIVNNGGGRIFSRLPSLGGIGEGRKWVTENRHAMSFDPWAALWGLAYYRGLPERIAEDVAVIELRPDEAETEAFWKDCDR